MDWQYFRQVMKIFLGICLLIFGFALLLINLFVFSAFDVSLLLLNLFLLLGGVLTIRSGVALLPRD